MPIRPPRALRKPLPANPVSAALEHEVLAEKAATYARLMARLEKALAALAETPAESPKRTARLDAAGEALWYVLVQRDLCGFGHTEAFLRQMNVPKAVRLRVGPLRSR